MTTITPHLWFDTQGREAAEYYCSVFPDSRILSAQVFENTGPTEEETVDQVEFELMGQRVLALSAGPHVQLNEGFSFFVECDTQDEVDEYWSKLTADGGKESQCGWLTDRFGVSWQIVPKLLGELLQDEDPERAKRVMHAMLKMVKIGSSELQAAYDAVGKT